MSGYTELVKTIKEIRRFIQARLTPELMKSLDDALSAIKNSLGDPALQANLKASLNQVNSLLQSINQGGIVTEVSGIVGDFKKANLINQVSGIVSDLKKADIINQAAGIVGDLRAFLHENEATLGSTLHTLNNLLKEAEKASMIQNIMKALESVNSFKDLVELAKDLSMPAKILMYGTTGAVMGLALTHTIKTFLDARKNSQLQDSLDKMIAIHMQQLYVQIQQLRVQAAEYKRGNLVARHQHPGLSLSPDLRNLEDEATRMLAVLSPIDPDALELLSKAQEFGKKMLEFLYQPELDNESMPDYLDRINDSIDSWPKLAEAVAFDATLLSKATRPVLPRIDLNYFQIKKMYGEKEITGIMQSLVQGFQNNGGSDFYAIAANSYTDSSQMLSDALQQIPEEKLAVNEAAPDTQSVCRLHNYYHEQAIQHIHKQWDETNWANHPQGKPILNERVRAIIRNRALLEFAYQTAPYLCFPGNLPRDVYNGVLDVPKGVYQFFRHPVVSGSNLYNNLFTAEGWRGMGRAVTSHPMRLLSGQAASAGVGMAVAGIAHRVSAASHAVTATNGRALLQTPPPPPAVATTMIHAAERGGALGSLPVVLSNKEQTGTEEAASEHERCNEAPASTISQEKLSELLENIHDPKNQTDLYTTISQWYEEIARTNLNQATVSSAIEGGFFAANGSLRQRAQPNRLSAAPPSEEKSHTAGPGAGL